MDVCIFFPPPPFKCHTNLNVSGSNVIVGNTIVEWSKIKPNTVKRWRKISYYRWPHICSACRNHNPVRSPFMICDWVCWENNTTGATSGAEIVYHSGAQHQSWHFITSVESCWSISIVLVNLYRVGQSLVLCVL